MTAGAPSPTATTAERTSLLRRASGGTAPGRGLLVSLLFHAALFAVAAVVAGSAGGDDDDDAVQLTFIDAPEPEAGGGGAPAPQAPPTPEPPPPVAPPRRWVPRTPVIEDLPFDPEPVEPLVEPASTGSAEGATTAEGGTGSGTGSGQGQGTGSGTGSGAGAGQGNGLGAVPRPIYLTADMQQPRLLAGEQPEYTPLARESRIEGVIVARLEVGADGRVRDVTILDGLPLLDDVVVRAVRRWRFTPTIVDGRPVSIYLIQRIRFQLPRE